MFVRAVDALDSMLEALAKVFHVLANACLLLMLFGTAATIVLRQFGVSFYWIWPWSMLFFVWMSFIGFFVIYRRRKDIAVDYLIQKLGLRAMRASRFFVSCLIVFLMAVILFQMPTIFDSQVGPIDGVITPWGELERFSLSVPLAVSCALILLNSLVDAIFALLGRPEPGQFQGADSGSA